MIEYLILVYNNNIEIFNIKNIKKFTYLGKLVKDIKTSLGPSNFEASCLLYFMLASTILK